MAATKNPHTAQEPKGLSGVEKVAVLLLALGRPRATQVLKRFDADELKLLANSAASLKPVSAGDLNTLVEEFANKFSTGVNFVGTAKEVESLLAEVLAETQGQGEEDALPDPEPRAVEEPVWGQISRIKEDVLRAYLLKDHPQAAALILSKIDAALAAKLVATFAPEVRSELLMRMLSIKAVPEDAARAITEALKEDLLAAPAEESGDSHSAIANIMNRLDKSQSEEILQALAAARPDDAHVLKGMLFTFEDLTVLDPRARTMLFDQVPIERVVSALRGTEPEFQGIILSSLASRSRRMVEAELQNGGAASAREVTEARRLIVDVVLKMIAKGEIEVRASDAPADGEEAA